MNRRILTTELALTLLLISGCQKKKPSVPPPQAQAPVTTAPATAPSSTTAAEKPAPTTPSTTAPAAAPEAETQKPSPSTPKRASSSTRRHSGSKKPANSTPPATVAKASPPPVPNPTPDAAVGQISPDMSQKAQSESVQSTTKLLDQTDQSLRGITRTLSTDEQNTVSQIRSYMVQSRSALRDQDFERAHNLAVKAHSLTDGLLKQ